MPFTLAHPALVLPLKYVPRRYFSVTGLVIGSMLPDFEYFLRMRIYSVYSHTLPALLWFCLPLGIILAFLFHGIARDSLIVNLPSRLRLRFSRFKGFDWNGYFKQNWVIVSTSILIGAASHLLWDSFAHETGWFVALFPALTGTVAGTGIPVYKLLQHGSTLIGFTVILLFIWKMPEAGKIENHVNKRYWPLLISITILIVILRLMAGLDPRAYGNVIVTGLTAVMLAMVITPLVLRRRL